MECLVLHVLVYPVYHRDSIALAEALKVYLTCDYLFYFCCDFRLVVLIVLGFHHGSL